MLVVDDEPSVIGAVARSLRGAGLGVDGAASGQAALESVQASPPDLVVLDTTLPDMDGRALARKLRALGIDAPVLFLVAGEATANQMAGLSVGACDCLTKPFALADVVARVRLLLCSAASGSQEHLLLRFADVEMDESAREVRRAGALIRLTAMEYNVLRFFLANPGRALSRTEIVDHVWPYDFQGDAHLVEWSVSHLRRKLDPHGPRLIHTVPRVGYVLLLRDAGAGHANFSTDQQCRILGHRQPRAPEGPGKQSSVG